MSRRFASSMLGRVLAVALLASAGRLSAAEWRPGARVIVEKAGFGHRAIVVRAEPARCFVAYEGTDEIFDEWVELDRLRSVRPQTAATAEPPVDKDRETKETDADLPVPEPLPRGLELPRAARGAVLAEAWLEQLPRTEPGLPVLFNAAALALPRFDFGKVAGIPTARPPLRTALLQSQGRVRGFAAIEDGIVLYGRDDQQGFVAEGKLDLAVLEGFAPEFLLADDFNHDGETDLIVAGGPVVQVFFGSNSGRFGPSGSAYRGLAPVRGVAAGRFFTGALSAGIAVIEGFDTFRLLRLTQSGITPVDEPYRVKFDRITRIAAGDFDGDGFTDVAITAEHRGRSTGAWMYFNHHGANKPFLWPVGGRDDFARDLVVADLDRDGRDDLIMTDSEAEHGDRIRVVFGSAGRAGWEDPWDLISSEFGLGLGTASITVGDYNRDGRIDIGVGGRNGLRFYLGADYRRFSRNPVWPRLVAGSDFPEQRVFLGGDFDGDGGWDLLGHTPAFATGYNLLFNATATAPDGVHVPRPLHRRTPTQAGTTVAKIDGASDPLPPGVPQIRYLASRAEPYGQWRYRIVVEVAVISDNVIEALDATCQYDNVDQPLQVVAAVARRMNDQQWSVEIVLPRGRVYEFRVTARDDKGKESEPLRVTVNP